MYIAFNLLLLLVFSSFPSVVYLCYYQLNAINGTIEFPTYDNNIQCTWIFNITSISNKIYFQSLLITFRHFDTEFGHDELFIGETIPDVSRYNSKFCRFSGRKIPEPCLIHLRGNILIRSIWMEFISDQTNTGSGFVLDYVFQSNQTISKSKQLFIDAEIRHPMDNKTKNSKVLYPFPRGSISSPNYPQNYSNNIICRWHIYHRHAFIRLSIEEFHLESHYDTLTIQLGQNLNNRAMILYEFSGDNIEQKEFFISNDNLHLIFTTDQTNNASGFLLHYEVIEKKIDIRDIRDDYGQIHSEYYPQDLMSNCEYVWNIHMNDSNEFQVILHDIDLDWEQDYLQIITDEMIYSLTTPKLYRISSSNQIKILLRTKHAQINRHYRGFNLTYQKWTRKIEQVNELIRSPCGRTFTSRNGTIEFYAEIFTSLDCLIFIEVDDGQNIFVRFDDLQWDKRENFLEIGLLHDYNQHRIFHISDAIPKTWFVANDSQIWIRFSSSQYSLGVSAFRLYYSETIQWSTVSLEPYVQVLNDHRLFPYRLISLPTYQNYHNLTQTYIWHIDAWDDECIRFNFQSFQAIDHRRICFSIKDFFQTIRICSDQSFPSIYHHLGSCTLSIEPEFISMLIQYEIHIEKFKKLTTMDEVSFHTDRLPLSLPVKAYPFIHHEWFIDMDNFSSIIVFDIENVDENLSAELILFQNINTTVTYILNEISSKRFAHVFFNYTSPIRIIYKSFPPSILNQERLFRLNLYKISEDYFHQDDFHYIFFQKNQTNSQWSIHGQDENSTFLASLYSSNRNLSLQTTANIDLTMKNSSIRIPSSDFDIRYSRRNKSEFLLLLHEQSSIDEPIEEILSNRTFDSIETSQSTSYTIQIHSTLVDTIDLIIIKADDHTVIRLYDFNSHINGYLLLNSAVIQSKGLSSLIGLRFSIRSLNIQLQLQSLSKHPIEIRYRTRRSFNHTDSSHHCFLADLKHCQNNSTCNSSCSYWFDSKSTLMNYSRIDRLWPYALRGSVTLIIENTTVENFESNIYRTLRQSIARIVRKFCLKSQEYCLSQDANAIRADHVIIQSYDEQIDQHRLYVAIFIKDPYRRTIALTNEQFFLALKRYREEIYEDIQHYINLPTNISDEHSLDPIWLYGVCLLAVLVLFVVILMLITILIKRTSRSLSRFHPKTRTTDNCSNSIQPARDDDDGGEEQNQLTSSPESESSDLSNSTLLAHPLPTMTCHFYSPTRPSYFNSTIESAMKQHVEDDGEPIPFIDENLSTAHSRKSSACWSDRTSLSSRLSLIWKLNRMRNHSQNRSNGSKRNEKRRAQQRAMKYTIPPSQPNEQL